MIQVAILGFGTVGSGVWDVIYTNQKMLAEEIGAPIQVKYVLDLREFPNHDVAKVLVHDFSVIENDPEISIVVETMGGAGAAYRFVKAALLAGKSVVTSNKVLVAEYGTELMTLARERNINFLFEASCGGGIPVIRPINTCLNADVLDTVMGILNGTTNYILTMMDTKEADFAEVLKDAQAKGYAEADPTADVEGFDTQRKIAILSSLAYGEWITYSDIPTQGISKISIVDMKYAKAMNCSIKLLGKSRKTAAGISAIVAPYLISANDPLYVVNDIFNAVMIHGNMAGNTMFYGSGAGKLPTASAVVGDIVETAKNPARTLDCKLMNHEATLIPLDSQQTSFFVRVKNSDPQTIQNTFGNCNFICLAEYPDEIGFVTGRMAEGAFQKALAGTSGLISYIRVLNSYI